MGVRTVALLRALTDRTRSTDELAYASGMTETMVLQLLTGCLYANVAVHRGDQWSLTRAGRRLLETYDRRAEPPSRVALAYMMRENRGLATTV